MGVAADGVHDLVGFDVAAAGEYALQAVGGLLDAGKHLAAHDVDALLAHLGGKVVADVVIEAAQDLLAAIEQRRLHPEPVEDAGELDRDIAAARHHHAARQALQVEGLVGGDDMLDARHRLVHVTGARRWR